MSGPDEGRDPPRWPWAPHGLVLLIVTLPILLVPGWLASRSSLPSEARRDIAGIMSALDEFAIGNAGQFPESLQALVAPDGKGDTLLDRAGHARLLDPWKRPYLYEPPGPGRARPRVWTLGRDGKPGGIGDDADIDSDRLRLED